MTVATPAPPLLTVPAWNDIHGLVHGFYGRRGGVSRGAFESLNLSARVGDADDAVHENWRRVRAAAGADLRFGTMRQVHGTEVVTVTRDSPDAGEADAVVSQAAGLVLTVLTADCVPLLLLAARERVVAAVHAGWRGTLAGIVQRAVQHLTTHFGIDPSSLSVAVGPSIGGCCYEVDASIVETLEQRWGHLIDAIRPSVRLGKAYLDLRRANALLLIRAGVPAASVEYLGPCTRCAVADYFSYRAADGPTGRQLSFIGWRE